MKIYFWGNIKFMTNYYFGRVLFASIYRTESIKDLPTSLFTKLFQLIFEIIKKPGGTPFPENATDPTKTPKVKITKKAASESDNFKIYRLLFPPFSSQPCFSFHSPWRVYSVTITTGDSFFFFLKFPSFFFAFFCVFLRN